MFMSDTKHIDSVTLFWAWCSACSWRSKFTSSQTESWELRDQHVCTNNAAVQHKSGMTE